MLRCGHCEIICESYEEWLAHLCSETHQAKLGVSEIFTNHNKDPDRNQRSLLVYKISDRALPSEIVREFACLEPLSFITDFYAHQFFHVADKFYLVVFDQKKFVERTCEFRGQHGIRIVNSLVSCSCKADLSEKEWSRKIQGSFFYRRHEHLRISIQEMIWDEQFGKFLNTVSLDQVGYQAREKIMEEMESLIHEEYPDAKLHPFGSCATWLADANADLDVYVDAAGNGGRSDLTKEAKDKILTNVAKLFTNKYDPGSVYTLLSARIPIIKFDHPSGLHIEISFENCLSVQNSKMIRLMTKLDYRIRPFLIFLRYWARFHNLIGTYSIKNYALTLMAFVFLRKQKILPSVHELQSVEGTRVYMVCNWNGTFCASRDLTQFHLPWLKCRRENPSDRLCPDIMKLIYDFFKEIVDIDFNTQVVCPFIGGYLPKTAFASQFGKELPKEMELLKANLVTEQCKIFSIDDPLCIQDPFALNTNVTASCASHDIISSLKAACINTMEALKPFVSRYDSADMENILEICCKHVLPEEGEEPELGEFSEQNLRADGSDIIQTENGLTENNNPYSPLNQSYLSPFSKYDDGGRDRDLSKRQLKSSDREISNGRRNRNQERSRSPVRIQRIYLNDNTEETGVFRDRDRNSGDYSYGRNQTRSFSSTSSMNQKENNYGEKEENKATKTLKSVVSVPSSSSSTTSSSQSSPKRKIPKRSSSSTTSCKNKTEAEDEKHVKYNQIVVMVENDKPKPTPIVTFIHPSSTLSQSSVSFQANPITNYSKSETLPAPTSIAASTIKPSTSSAVVKNEEYITTEKDEEAEVDESVDEKIFRFMQSVEQIPPPDITVRFDCDTNNYGYAINRKTFPIPKPSTALSSPTSVQQIPKQQTQMIPKSNTNSMGVTSIFEGNKELNSSTLKPGSKAVVSGDFPNRNKSLVEYNDEDEEDEETSPSFAIYLSDEFQQHFYESIHDINIDESICLMKMKILWVMAMVDLFGADNLWRALAPVVNSFKELKIKNVDDLFHKDHSQYTGSINGMTPCKLRRTNNFPPLSYDEHRRLFEKLNKIPDNVGMRKQYAVSYTFKYNPVTLNLVWTAWVQQQGFAYAGGPLTLLEKITKNVNRSYPQSNFNDWFQYKVLMVADTLAETPEYLFELEYEHRQDDPNFEKQAEAYSTLQNLIQDLTQRYLTFRLNKFFK